MAKPPNYKAGACRSSRVSNVRYKIKIKNKQKMRFPNLLWTAKFDNSSRNSFSRENWSGSLIFSGGNFTPWGKIVCILKNAIWLWRPKQVNWKLCKECVQEMNFRRTILVSCIRSNKNMPYDIFQASLLNGNKSV